VHFTRGGSAAPPSTRIVAPQPDTRRLWSL